MAIQIRKTNNRDLQAVINIHCDAFGYEKEAELVQSLFEDPSAQPLLSLIACKQEKPVGHILFTRVSIEGCEHDIYLLAPLAVIPDEQKSGIGGKLIEAGLAHLSEVGAHYVFVLGHPSYYPKHGFVPAHTFGLTAPYPIPPEHAGAWMVQALNDAELGAISGNVCCADALNKPEYWRE